MFPWQSLFSHWKGEGFWGPPSTWDPPARSRTSLGFPNTHLHEGPAIQKVKEMALEHRHINEEIAQVGAEGGGEKNQLGNVLVSS